MEIGTKSILAEVAQDYKDAGFNPLPLRAKDKPLLPEGHGFLYKPIDDIEGRFNRPSCTMIGIACGKVSDNFEALDFDAKKGQPIEEIYKSFCSDPGAKEILSKCYIERTPSGGFHICYKTTSTFKRTVWARWEDNEVMIETMAQGYYLVVSPSLNYNHIAGVELVKIGRLEDDERKYLIDLASSLNRKQNKVAPTDNGSGADTFERDITDPVNFFNFSGKGKEHAKKLLNENGWTEGENDRWTRPGKDEGTSATWDHKYNALFVFSSSVDDFKPQNYYTPFQIVTRLRFNDDWHQAQQWVIEKYDLKFTSKENECSDNKTLQDFDQYRITDQTDIPPIEVVATINGEPIAVRDEITVISGAEKTGKSAIQTQIISEALSYDCTDNIHGLTVEKATDQVLIHIDTEQARAKQQYTVRTILRKGKLDTCPDNFLSYNFRHLEINEMMPILTGILEAATKQFNTIHTLWIDGVADFIQDSNDLQTSIDIVRNFMHIAAKYRCAVFCIIHTNPGGNKERGHLGSELLRKSGSVLTVTQDEQEVSTMKAKRLRYGGKGKIGDCMFKYDIEKGYHVGIDKAESDQIDAKAAAKMAQVKKIALQIFAGGGLTREDALNKIMVTRACQLRTAEGDFALMTSSGLIEKTNMNLYTLTRTDEDEQAPF